VLGAKTEVSRTRRVLDMTIESICNLCTFLSRDRRVRDVLNFVQKIGGT